MLLLWLALELDLLASVIPIIFWAMISHCLRKLTPTCPLAKVCSVKLFTRVLKLADAHLEGMVLLITRVYLNC